MTSSRMIKNHEQIPAINTLIEIKYTTHSKQITMTKATQKTCKMLFGQYLHKYVPFLIG